MRRLKLIYTVIDGMGDLPIEELGDRTPLEAAETHNMDMLAKSGRTGLMYTVGKGIAPESDVAVISILGYDPFEQHAARGSIEAYGAGLEVKEGDLALRCNFATIDRDGRIIDRRVGRSLTTDEARVLAEAVNREVKLESYPVDFEFRNTFGHRAVLVIKSKKGPLSGEITNTDPAYERVEGFGVAKKSVEMVLQNSRPMEETEAARISAELVNEFVRESHIVLERHEINKKRIAEGKLSANVIITRDAGSNLPKFFDMNEKYGVNFACFIDMPVERGIARLAGMHVVELPPPSGDLEADCLLRVERLLGALPFYDCFYIHIKGPDEPGHDGNYELKTKMIEVVDRYFFGKLLPKIDLEECIICVTADHSTPCRLKAHSDDPVPLLISGNMIPGDDVQRFSEKDCKGGSLGTLSHGRLLMPMLMKLLKGAKSCRIH
ncbi:MAG: alkaline phosphatase family protein [Candidatus Bathyarchaeia archaeon]